MLRIPQINSFVRYFTDEYVFCIRRFGINIQVQLASLEILQDSRSGKMRLADMH